MAAAIESRTAEAQAWCKRSRLAGVDILHDLSQAETIWRDLEGSLLLPGSTIYKILVMDHLQPDQTAANQAEPEDEEKRDMQQAKPSLHRAGSHRASRRITRALRLNRSALWLAKERERFQLHLPCWS